MIDRVEREIDMLDRHLQILRTVIANEPISIVKIGNATGYPHHKVRYSLRVLETERLIEPSIQGATTTNYTAEFMGHLDEHLDTIIDRLDTLTFADELER
jgi:predicted transcriptional regulator